MSEVLQCDRCKRIIPEDEYGVSTASPFTLQMLKDGVWCNYHGDFCESCVAEFRKWLGAD